MSTPIHAIAWAIMVLEHSTFGMARAFFDDCLAVLVAVPDFDDLDNGTIAELRAPALLWYKISIAVRRIGLGMML